MHVKGPFDALYPDWTAEQWFHYGALLGRIARGSDHRG